MMGVMCGIDAIGYEAEEFSNPSMQNPMEVMNDLVKIVNPTGHIGSIGVFLPQDPGGVDENAKQGKYLFPFGEIWDKGLSIGTGQTPVKRYSAFLRDLIISGNAKPSFIISHHLPITDAPDAYDKFDKRTDGYTKVILHPNK